MGTAIVVKVGGELEHYGRKGMKWYQHIFGREDSRAQYSKSGGSKGFLDEKVHALAERNREVLRKGTIEEARRQYKDQIDHYLKKEKLTDDDKTSLSAIVSMAKTQTDMGLKKLDSMSDSEVNAYARKGRNQFMLGSTLLGGVAGSIGASLGVKGAVSAGLIGFGSIFSPIPTAVGGMVGVALGAFVAAKNQDNISMNSQELMIERFDKASKNAKKLKKDITEVDPDLFNFDIYEYSPDSPDNYLGFVKKKVSKPESGAVANAMKNVRDQKEFEALAQQQQLLMQQQMFQQQFM